MKQQIKAAKISSGKMTGYKMKQLYSMALAEGEGLGTAYEYYVKLRLLDSFVKNKNIRTVLIYGLPEKYGLSMDFFYFCKRNGFTISLLEKRTERIDRLKNILGREINRVSNLDRDFDFALSCEVLQRLADDEQKRFIEDIRKHTRYAAVFVPNKENRSHARFSGLSGFMLKELRALFDGIKKSGYIDMPPFPPGIKKKKRIKSALALDIMVVFAYLEKFIPSLIKKRAAHICYVLIE